jgi:hypothetical protein
MVLVCGLTTLARAEVHVEGSLAAVRVTSSRDKVSDVLSALATTLNIRYRTAVPLDAPANQTYSGSIGQIMSRLLEGYSYVIKTDQDGTEIVVFGKHGDAAVAPKAPAPKGVTSRWR